MKEPYDRFYAVIEVEGEPHAERECEEWAKELAQRLSVTLPGIVVRAERERQVYTPSLDVYEPEEAATIARYKDGVEEKGQ